MNKFYCLFGGRFENETSLRILSVEANSIAMADEIFGELAEADPEIDFDLWTMDAEDFAAFATHVETLKNEA